MRHADHPNFPSLPDHLQGTHLPSRLDASKNTTIGVCCRPFGTKVNPPRADPQRRTVAISVNAISKSSMALRHYLRRTISTAFIRKGENHKSRHLYSLPFTRSPHSHPSHFLPSPIDSYPAQTEMLKGAPSMVLLMTHARKKEKKPFDGYDTRKTRCSQCVESLFW